MSVFSSKNFLALFAMAACMAASFSTVDAAGIRGLESRENNLDNEERILKGGSKGKGKGKGKHKGMYGGSGNTFGSNSFPVAAQPQALVVARNPMSVEAFDENCPNEANALDNCVSSRGGDQDACMTCVIGIANLAFSTVNGLYGCSRAGGGVDGFCKKCDAEVIAYHNCGTGKNFGAPVDSVAAVPQAGAAAAVDPAEVVATAKPSEYAPQTTCPWEALQSGDSCTVQAGFKYLQCYSGGLLCECRAESPIFLCN